MAFISSQTFRFMQDLWDNNNKSWFDANRKLYQDTVREPLKTLAQALAEPVRAMIPDFVGDPKISRINNDIRFHPNKPPYKEHMWVSFNSGGMSDIFIAVDRHGWSTGCGIACPKREAAEHWRRNLIQHAETWRGYWGLLKSHRGIDIYTENLYKKPLFPDIPNDLYDLVQAKAVWLVQSPRQQFEKSPEDDFVRELKSIAPLYLFMNVPPEELKTHLDTLG